MEEGNPFVEEHAKLFEDADPLSFLSKDPAEQEMLTRKLHSEIFAKQVYPALALGMHWGMAVMVSSSRCSTAQYHTGKWLL